MIIFNNTVLVNFSITNTWDIIHKLFNSINITSQVYEEVLDGINGGHEFMSIVITQIENGFIEIIQFPVDKIFEFNKLLETLDYGEASCITCCNKHTIFYTDDLDARKVSKKMNIKISGSIGILSTALKIGIIDIEEADNVLKQMISFGYRSPIKSFSGTK